MRRQNLIIVACIVVLSLLVVGGLGLAAPADQSPPATIAKGGQLYDKWWTAAGVAAPQGDHPLWATQTTNTRKGLDTWRCKECHGWDYKGKDGAYGSGSHKTGFAGIVDASKNKTQEQIAGILRGSSNSGHNFGAVLDDANINALAAFIKEGIVQDLAQYVDYASKKPKAADATRGQKLFTDTCSFCHGSDGLKLNFGTDKEPEYLRTVADNPQEFLHKVRFGQPGALMPTGVQNGWTVQDGVDVLAFAQTLPDGKPAAAEKPATPAAGPDVARGAQVYQNSCATCHGKEGEGNLGIPNLAGAAGHVQQLGIPPDQMGPGMIKLLRDGIAGNMPAFPPTVLSDEDIANLGAFAFTLPPTTGANIYVANCALCHGSQGQGAVGPALAGAAEKFAKLGLSKEQVMATFPDLVRKGIPGKMPANPQLSDTEVGRLGEYLWALGSWEADFQATHGRAPTAADRADRTWSLQFAHRSGRNPTDQDWITRYNQSR